MLLQLHPQVKTAIQPIGPNGKQQAVEKALALLFPNPGPIHHHPDGAPYLSQHPGLCLTISHCLTHAAVGLSTLTIGIDIENPRPQQLARVATRFANPDEIKTFNGNLLQIWTIKEAAYKALRTPGLSLTAITATPTTAHAQEITLQTITTQLPQATLTLAIRPD